METTEQASQEWQGPINPPEQPETAPGDPDTLLHQVIERDPATLEELSDDERTSIRTAFEGSKEIGEYQKGPSPIDRIEMVLGDIDRQGGALNLEAGTLREVRAKGERFLDDVKEAVHNYGSSVRAFTRSKIAAYHLGEERWMQQLKRHDENRRRSHEALMDTLRIYNRYMSITVRQRYGMRIDGKELFNDQLFHDRNYQSDWALNTDYYLRAKHLVESLEQEENG